MSVDDIKKECETENRKKERESLIQEILDTETNYVSDLKCCVDIFLKPSDADKFNSEGVTIDQLFLNFEKIYETSEKLLKLLNKHVKGFDFNQQIVGQCFLEVSKELENVYSYYCVNITSALEYESEVAQHPLILDKIKQLTDHYQNTTQIIALNSLLTKPVQRITKYHLLLESLLAVTEVSHIDFSGLDQAHSCMKNVANNVNESIRAKEIVTKYLRPSNASFRSKIASISSHAVEKKLRRLKGVVVSKTGLTPTVEDEEFDCNLQKFISVQKTVSDLKKNLEDYLKEFEKSTITFDEFVNHVVDLYGDAARNSFVSHLQELNRSSCSFCQSVVEKVTTLLLRPLIVLIKLYEGPEALIKKRNDKLMEIYGNESLELVKKEYESLNCQLIKGLPDLCRISSEVVLDIIVNFILLKNYYQDLWFTELKKFIEFIEMKDDKNQNEPSNWQILLNIPVLPSETCSYIFPINTNKATIPKTGMNTDIFPVTVLLCKNPL
ncbi:rho guanine nucleotide exchange factor 38 isoform X2 [Octopus bimaculoides]|uniref:rho guanine nucleotide exchange factor 38 isoform X2 n=1 Tax=Octopus bimaculoides TaxID=37653 RepID=UPI0022DF51DE|nr:rho guanine nucleotide exchange factor 38 isoform X2 [Octopus bimaculoides]